MTTDDLPKRIFAWDQGEWDQRWSDEPVEGTPDEVEYIRADIAAEEQENWERRAEHCLESAVLAWAEVERLRAALKDIAHASPGLGYDYEDLQDLAAEALAHQPERKEENDG